MAETPFCPNIASKVFCSSNNNAKLDLGSMLVLETNTIGFAPKFFTQKSKKITKVLSGAFSKKNRTFVLNFICMQD